MKTPRFALFSVPFPSALRVGVLCIALAAAVPAAAQTVQSPTEEPPHAQTGQDTPPKQIATQPVKPEASKSNDSVQDNDPDTSFFAHVESLARKRAHENYQPDSAQAPDFLRDLKQNQWGAIQYKPEASLWRDEKLPFEVRLYHQGFIYNRGVTIHIVDGTADAELPFSTERFNYPNPTLPEKLASSGAAYAGFALYASLSGHNGPDGTLESEQVASFLGASYFQGRGKQSGMGAYARGIALNTALASGEEFPFFTEYWLVKPRPGDSAFTLYALMESPSMTGAYRFTITPGASVVMDVQCKLLPRDGASYPAKIGLGAMTSMYLFSETEGARATDYRPEVHGSDGFLFLNDSGGWNWAPLANPTRLGVSSYTANNPKGFGLVQRDDVFDHYQDLDKRFDRRPSLWVEPNADWGKGHIELIEIPATEDFHANIVAFWTPDDPAFLNANPRLTYRLYWMNPGVTPHTLGKVTSTRKAVNKDQWLYVIDFEGAQLNALPAETGLTSDVTVPDQVYVLEKRLVKNTVTGGWRLFLQLRVPQDGVVQSILTARDGTPRPRISAVLKRGENLPEPLTEVWINDLSM